MSKRNKDAARLAELREDLIYSKALQLLRNLRAQNANESMHTIALRLIDAAEKAAVDKKKSPT